MNLRQKKDIKDRIDSLNELLNCVNSSLIYEHTIESLDKISNMMLADLQAYVCKGDNLLALNIMLRIIKKLVIQLKGEYD